MGQENVTNVREWATSTKEMKCLYKESWHDQKILRKVLKVGRISPTLQLKTQNLPKKIEIKMEWSLYSHLNHPFWSSHIEGKF